jgi:hypothetical protein
MDKDSWFGLRWSATRRYGESPLSVIARHQCGRRATCADTSRVFWLKRIKGYAEAIHVDEKPIALIGNASETSLG